MYAYLIVKEECDHESLKAYKSLEGYRLHWDGHVQSLQTNTSLFLWVPPDKVQRETDRTRD